MTESHNSTDKPAWFSFPFISIIVSNLLVLAIALIGTVSITSIIWVYWCEGVLLGIIQFFRIFSLECSVEYLKKYKKLGQERPPGFFPFFFLLMQAPFYALFGHLIYLADHHFNYIRKLIAMGIVILAPKIFLYFRSPAWEENCPLPSMVRLFCIPFARFIPMWVILSYMDTIQDGKGDLVYLAVAFTLFKLFSDILLYIFEKD